MKKLTYSLWCLAIFLFSFTSCSKDSIEELETPELVTEAPPVAYTSFEMEVLDLVNDYRAEKGFSQLDLLDDSSRQAEKHNRHMTASDEVCHHDFPSRYSALVNSVKAKAVSENVAFGYNSAEAVVRAWINSDGHRENIEGNHTHFGISIIEDSEGKKYFTNIFVRK